MVASQALIHEVGEEKHSANRIAAALEQAHNSVHDSLGTAFRPEEMTWGIAHRVLASLFTLLAIGKMLDKIHKIATQLMLE